MLSPSARRIALDDSLNPLAPFLRWRSAVAQSDSSTLRSVRADLSRFGSTNLRAVALASQFDAAAIEDGARALSLLKARSLSHSGAIDRLLGEHAMALNEGRIRDALDAANALGIAGAGSHVDLRLRILDRLYGDGDTSLGARRRKDSKRPLRIRRRSSKEKSRDDWPISA